MDRANIRLPFTESWFVLGLEIQVIILFFIVGCVCYQIAQRRRLDFELDQRSALRNAIIFLGSCFIFITFYSLDVYSVDDILEIKMISFFSITFIFSILPILFKPQQERVSAFVWILSGMLFGVVCMFLAYAWFIRNQADDNILLAVICICIGYSLASFLHSLYFVIIRKNIAPYDLESDQYKTRKKPKGF